MIFPEAIFHLKGLDAKGKFASTYKTFIFYGISFANDINKKEHESILHVHSNQ